jgi:hypothetical protein
MANRTQIVYLHEGKKGHSIDPVFINTLIRALKPAWIRPFKGSNLLRPEPCGGRSELIKRMPQALKTCLSMGGLTTLMVWADLDADMNDGDQLKEEFWKTAQGEGITDEQFEGVVFVFAKYRLENWIQYFTGGATDENIPGPRIKHGHGRVVVDAAKKLADRCRQAETHPPLPPSLEWSCRNWRRLIERTKSS